MDTKKRYGILVVFLISMLMISNFFGGGAIANTDGKCRGDVNSVMDGGKSGGSNVNVYCDGYYDHCLRYHHSDYSTAHDASVAQEMDPHGSTQMGFGQRDLGYPGSPSWYVWRFYAYFDTSVIPNDATITNVEFTFTCCGHHNTAPDPKLMAFYDSSGTYPHRPLQMGDFDIDLYSDTGAGYYVIDWLDTYTWTWNSPAYNVINKNGWTKIMFTTQADWNANQALDQAKAEMRDGDSPDGSYLTIEYSDAPPGDPSNLNAHNPTTNSIDLSWTKGSGSD